MADVVDALAGAIASMTGGAAFATGVVTSVAGPKVVVTVLGGSKTLPRLAAYTTPAAGDVVLIACPDGAWCVLGKIATS
ncbi:hypothetical protein [Pseudonocardia sp. D17]|uniref:hypothetical protein n=1 Tax=Pseudonocardia sp. D17 TaxID=882661 RepID=UPI002B3B359F|nr:hypothetical protein PSD17_39210 [Pseudonocardia sp. D17]